MKILTALCIALYFYARTDILIWQRIFEANNLHELGIGVYHAGWFQSLLGYMALGALLLLPKWKQVVSFPVYLLVLSKSGLEDVLYYWLDGRAIPRELPWLNENPFMLSTPVTSTSLLVSSAVWVLLVCVSIYVLERLPLEKWLLGVSDALNKHYQILRSVLWSR